jgi:hypothetical protein
MAFICALPARSFDLANGLMYAVPVPNGQTPALDGTDAGWDLSAAEPLWMSTQLADQMHALVALNYDDQNLYIYTKASLPGRRMNNPNGPTDGYYHGDSVELRLCSDPSLGYPLNNSDPVMHVSKQVCHMQFWKDTNDGKDYISIQYGGMHGGGQGHVFNPPGAKLVFTESKNQFVMQAVLPWSALNVPGGKNPFKPGSRMTAIFGLHWMTPTYFYSVNAIYSSDPGDFAFLRWQNWGQVEFSPTGSLKPHHGTMEEALAAASAPPVGVPITINVPDAGKLSVNVLGENGEVIRDVAGGLDVKPGKTTVYWDGHDQWGFPLKPGKYRWGAYLSHGLKARYVAFVGSSGNPPYPTDDGKGGWGGDEGLPSAVAADESGIYFGWNCSEAQRQIVKIDYAGNTLWRKTPAIPFPGGYSLNALASNGKYLYGTYVDEHPVLTRLDPATGLFVLFGGELGQGGAVPIAPGSAIAPPPGSTTSNDWMSPVRNKIGGLDRYIEPECVGLAATATEVFASVYSQNIIQVLDAETGQPTRTLACPAPRGLALDAHGNLYAACYGVNQPPQIVRFDGAQGTAKPVVTSGLVSPLGVTIDPSGRISVTDEGASQQVKTFSSDGKLVRTLGKPGGRPLEGTYDPTSYRIPTGITADKQGGLVVAELSCPKIFDRIDNATGKTLAHWFGWPSYYLPNVPDCDDPFTCYIAYEPRGFARATAAPGKTGLPDAYWDIVDNTEFPESRMGGLPFIERLGNGRKYEISDVYPHFVYAIDGDNMFPVGYIRVLNANRPFRGVDYNPGKPENVEVWIDRNGDHVAQPDEVTDISEIDGKPLPMMPSVHRDSCIWIDKKGDAYIQTYDHRIVEIPSDGFAPNGSIKWNPAQARYVVPVTLACGDTNGAVRGLRTDSKGNIYVVMSVTQPALTPAIETKIEQNYPGLPRSDWGAFATADMAKQMMAGLGHTAESNAAKFAKFGPDGKLLWMAGRKATAGAKPGEIYHFYTIGGLVGDDYVAGASQWGTMCFYTSDGFYVDTIMNDPAALPPAGPYTFSGETMGGRVQAFPKLGKVYAYNEGGIYVVDGFDENLKVAGEQRLHGMVDLDKVYEVAGTQTSVAPNLQVAPILGNVSDDPTWNSVPVSTLLTPGGATLATAQVGYDADNLYAKFHVADDTPLQNGGDDPKVVFKNGDVIGLDLGPAGDRSKPILGDLRILAARMKGQDRLMAMKPLSAQPKNPQSYSTPATGTKPFDFVGDIPGGKVVLTIDPDHKGYTALLTVPRSFLEFPIAAGTPLKGDVEVLLSGYKSQGLQAVSRNWLFSGGHSQTTMTDDIPTEAWLYPQFWGDVTVK